MTHISTLMLRHWRAINKKRRHENAQSTMWDNAKTNCFNSCELSSNKHKNRNLDFLAAASNNCLKRTVIWNSNCNNKLRFNYIKNAECKIFPRTYCVTGVHQQTRTRKCAINKLKQNETTTQTPSQSCKTLTTLRIIFFLRQSSMQNNHWFFFQQYFSLILV